MLLGVCRRGLIFGYLALPWSSCHHVASLLFYPFFPDEWNADEGYLLTDKRSNLKKSLTGTDDDDFHVPVPSPFTRTFGRHNINPATSDYGVCTVGVCDRVCGFSLGRHFSVWWDSGDLKRMLDQAQNHGPVP
jgi:hypothetical protein